MVTLVYCGTVNDAALVLSDSFWDVAVCLSVECGVRYRRSPKQCFQEETAKVVQAHSSRSELFYLRHHLLSA